jgi:hypothetical protein
VLAGQHGRRWVEYAFAQLRRNFLGCKGVGKNSKSITSNLGPGNVRKVTTIWLCEDQFGSRQDWSTQYQKVLHDPAL